MNVNGSKFVHLLGKYDWGQCSVPFDGALTKLSKIWRNFPGGGADVDIPLWNASSGRLTLAETGETIKPTLGEARLLPHNRRGTACDCYGNLYVVGEDAASVVVVNSGEAKAYHFWPDPRVQPPRTVSDFADAQPVYSTPLAYTALAITTANYLIVATHDGNARWLLRFDLVGGGAPVPHDISAYIGTPIIDLAADHCDGLWVLAADGIRRLGPDFQPESDMPAVATSSSFQPVDGSETRVVQPSAVPPIIALPLGATALQMQITRLGELIVHLRTAANVSQIHVLDRGGISLRHLPGCPDSVHAIAVGPAVAEPGEKSDAGEALYVTTNSGNQAFLYRLRRDDAGLIDAIVPEPAIIPLRRFGGRALQLRGKEIVYDSGSKDPLWVPLLAQIKRRYALSNSLTSAIYDCNEPQCLWDRIRLDANIPPGTDVRIEVRSHDEKEVLEAMGDIGWQLQPPLYLNGDGGELPGKRAIAQLSTDRLRGQGCWDMLLQQITGRFVQLRITLTGDGRHTPALRSLRIWYPRFSYAQQFLPALYREDPISGSFVERFLANMEGINSGTEERIATAQTQFDPRTARDEMLPWLASWFDVMLDPSWNEARSRLFLANAIEFFSWRGTIAGLKLALRLAFDAELLPADFLLGKSDCTCAGSIRIVEAFSTQSKGRKFGKAETILTGPALRSLTGGWSPAEGAAGLLARLPEESEWTPDTSRFPLFAPDEGAADWQGLALQVLGFVPWLGAQERAAWQAFQIAQAGEVKHADLPATVVPTAVSALWGQYLSLISRARGKWQSFLQNRYRRIDALKKAHKANWASFAEIPLPDYLPSTEVAAQDWLLFEGQLYPRILGAHRFSVLIPLASVNANAAQLEEKIALAQRIIAIEKPAHTVFDVRFYWAMNRVGEARIGQDTQIGAGSRAPELIPPAIVGQAYLGSNFVSGAQGRVKRRERLAC